MRDALADTLRHGPPVPGAAGRLAGLDAAAAGAKVLAAVRRAAGAGPPAGEGTAPVAAPRSTRRSGAARMARAVYGNPDLPAGAVDRDAYVVCVLEQLHKALRARDIFAAPSLRWA